MFENLFDNLIVVIVLVGLFALAYTRFTGKTLVDLIKELREAFSSDEE